MTLKYNFEDSWLAHWKIQCLPTKQPAMGKRNSELDHYSTRSCTTLGNVLKLALL